MPLHKALLNFASDINISGVTFAENSVLVEQLLENMAIEQADIEAVIAAITQASSERVKLSLFKNLCEFSIQNRFTIAPLNTFQEPQHLSDEQYKEQLMVTLSATYWGSLISRLNLPRILNDINRRKLTAQRLTIYTDENPVQFTRENIELFFTELNNLEDFDQRKQEFKAFINENELELTLQKNGMLVIREIGRYKSNNFMQNMEDFLFTFTYATDPKWFNYSDNINKKYGAEFNGIEFFPKLKIIKLSKENSKKFIEFFDIKPVVNDKY